MINYANGTKPILEPLPLYERVYLSIKRAILAGDFKPGERLTDQRLSSFLGVSSTPVREAVKLWYGRDPGCHSQ